MATGAQQMPPVPVRTTPFHEPLPYQNDQFTKTGSGQTEGKADEKTGVFSAGGGKLQPPYNPPGGFEYNSSLLPQAATWRNATGAVFHARGGTNPYFSYMCLVSGVDKAQQRVHFDPGVGCDQGGPTTKTGAAWDWFIEGVLEECDDPGEFYVEQRPQNQQHQNGEGHQAESTEAPAEGGAGGAAYLYYTFNASETPTGDESLSLTRTKVLLNITGNATHPVRNVTVRGIIFRDAALTYLGTTEADYHELPSTGDWYVVLCHYAMLCHAMQLK